jgi:hypothetical protein
MSGRSIPRSTRTNFRSSFSGGNSDAIISITNGSYYARVGWTVRPTDQQWFLVEYNGGGEIRRLFFPFGQATTHFKVVWNNAPGGGVHLFTFWAGTESTPALLWNPELNWSPTDGQVGGRTVSYSSQFPGRPSNKTEFINTKAHVNGSWVGFGSVGSIGYAIGTFPNFVDVSGSTTHFRSWDADC